MMGRLEVQENLFCRFRIEDHVRQDHLLRRIDWLPDFDAIRAELASLYRHTGRPSVDPAPMLRIPLIGHAPEGPQWGQAAAPDQSFRLRNMLHLHPDGGAGSIATHSAQRAKSRVARVLR